ncbi:MAG: 3,4-dihydroxy-2-butanone-4-phosphate synthase [Alphaproteobacteria bacterium]|nr:3,4-dihydroxy-2-butanone-4-phosphate synthase [Alphaproteobacteria bacterium]
MSAQTQEKAEAALSSIDEILEDIRAGKPVIIVDDENRENEGDLIIAAEMASPENINFMAKDGRGLICLPMERAMVERLGLELMGRGDNVHHRTAFTVSIEAKEGVTTGISAADRATTIKAAINPSATARDIATPGHVFPLLARDGGVLERAGHTEAAVDLAKMAGYSGAGVICEIMNDDGTMARLPDLIGFADKHNLKIGTIEDLIAYRAARETLVKRIHEDAFKSRFGGDFRFMIYANTLQYAEHVALVKGRPGSLTQPVLVRMHAVDFMTDILGREEDSALHRSMELIDEAGEGVIVILREAHPAALSRKIKGTRLSDKEGELRRYGIGAQILRDLGVEKMTLLTDHPKNVVGLEGYGLYITGHKPISA